jgi:hypothetical protein
MYNCLVNIYQEKQINRRLSHHPFKAAMKKVINPMFTSKVQYALEVFGNPTSQICSDKEEDAIIKQLQVLHNMAMRAALGIGGKDRISCSRLLSMTGHTFVGEMCLRAVSRAAKIHIGMDIEGQESPLAGGRLILSQRTRTTRNIEKGLLTPQKSSGTLLAAMAIVGNVLPEAIKTEQSETKNEKKNCCILQ